MIHYLIYAGNGVGSAVLNSIGIGLIEFNHF